MRPDAVKANEWPTCDRPADTWDHRVGFEGIIDGVQAVPTRRGSMHVAVRYDIIRIREVFRTQLARWAI
jgi:hypothetical protein